MVFPNKLPKFSKYLKQPKTLFKVGGLLLIFFLIPLTVFLVIQYRDLRSKAVGSTVTAEAELATLTGSVSAADDSNASGGKYIQFGSAATGTSAVVVAVGDIACGADSTGAACKEMATSDLAVPLNPDAVLVLGDNQYEQGQLIYYDGSDPYCNSNPPRCYNATWGRFKNITIPVVGNHEYLTAGAAGHYDYFNGVGVQTGPAGDRSKGYFSTDVGSWHVVALNSNCTPAGGCGASSPQATWLKADLAAHPTACTLVGIHQPLYSSGGRSSTSVAPLFQILYDYNADLVLVGHDHSYERFAPQDASGNLDTVRGIREFVVGTGGRNHTPLVSTVANSEVFDSTSFGIMKLTLNPTSYDWQFIPIPGSSFTDSGSQACH